MTWPILLLVLGMALLVSSLVFPAIATATGALISGLFYGIGALLVWLAAGFRRAFGWVPAWLPRVGAWFARVGGAFATAGARVGRWVWRILGVILWICLALLLCIAVGAATGNWTAVAFFSLLPLAPYLVWKFLKVGWWSLKHPILAFCLLVLGIGTVKLWQYASASGMNQAISHFAGAKWERVKAGVWLSTTQERAVKNATDHKNILHLPAVEMRTGKVVESTGFYQLDPSGKSLVSAKWRNSPILEVGTPVAVTWPPEIRTEDGVEKLYRVVLPGPQGDFVAGAKGWVAIRRVDFQDPIPKARPVAFAPTPPGQPATVAVSPGPPFKMEVVNYRSDVALVPFEVKDGKELPVGIMIPTNRSHVINTTTTQHWILRDPNGRLWGEIKEPRPEPSGMLQVHIK